MHQINTLLTSCNINKWNLKKLNWPLYSNIIENIISEDQILNKKLNMHNIDNIVRHFTSIITDTAHKSIGKTL